MAKHKFNFLEEVMNDASKAKNTDTMVDIDLIDPFDVNDDVYPPEQYKDNLEEKIVLIRRDGLQQPVELMINPKDPSRYISYGGNTRCAAIRYLVHEEGLEQHRMVKAIVNENMTLDKAEEYCVLSNSYREKTPYTKMKEVEILQKSLERRKAEGEDIKGLRKIIASRTKMNETQVGKYQRVIKKGTEELKEALEKESISLEAAAELASINHDKQREIVAMVDSGKITSIDAEEIAVQIKKSEKEEKIQSEKKIEKESPFKKEKPQHVIINKSWNKIQSELDKLEALEESDKGTIQTIRKIIENRQDR